MQYFAMCSSLMRRPLLLSFLFLLAACSSTGYKKVTHPDLERKTLFPNGVYQHDIQLTIPSQAELAEKDFHFNGVVKISSDAIVVVALSPFGTTLFKIAEDRITHKISDEIYMMQMRKFEPKLLEYYSVLRELLVLRGHEEVSKELVWKETSPEGLPIRVELAHDQIEAVFKFSKYDKNKIPEEITIEGEHFNVKIKVVGYEI